MNSDSPKRQSAENGKPRTRYYTVFPDFERNPSDFDIVNESDAVNYANRAPGLLDHLTGRNFGLPEFKLVPCIRLGKNKKQDFIGIGNSFVSTRAKELLESIDSSSFDFVECDTTDLKGRRVESYWWLGVTHLVEYFSRERSEFETYCQDPELKGKFREGVISELFDIEFDDSLNGIAAFYLSGYSQSFIWSEQLVDAWRANKFTGRRFTPLQPPTAVERKSLNKTQNYLYWKKRLGI